MITVKHEYCPQNHPCPMVNICPTGAITQQGYAAPTIDQELCMDCGNCLMGCPAFQEVQAGPGARRSGSHREQRPVCRERRRARFRSGPTGTGDQRAGAGDDQDEQRIRIYRDVAESSGGQRADGIAAGHTVFT